MENVLDDLLTGDRGLPDETLNDLEEFVRKIRLPRVRENPRVISAIYDYLVGRVSRRAAREGAPLARGLRVMIPPPLDNAFADDLEGGRRRKSQTKRFGSCVKAVRKTVKARKGSTAEGAAIAICTTTLLHPRGRTLKRYRKGRLLTQKRRRSS